MRRFATVMAALLLFPCAGASAMELTSGDIAPGAQIAAAQIYPRCGGQNVSPALAWSGAPAGTKSLVLTMIDMDVKPAYWSHWIVVDLPLSMTRLARGLAHLPAGAKAIVSNFGDAFYDGPCPPNGTGVHHYRFTIWAMPTAKTEIANDAKANDVADKLIKTAIASASLVGWVQR